MGRQSRRGIAACVVVAAFAILGFQNCARISLPYQSGSQDLSSETASGDVGNGPSVQLLATTGSVAEGQTIPLVMMFVNVRDASLHCRDVLTGEVTMSQLVANSGESISVLVDRDLDCYGSGTSIFDRRPVQDVIRFEVDCGARVKNTATNRCQ